MEETYIAAGHRGKNENPITSTCLLCRPWKWEEIWSRKTAWKGGMRRRRVLVGVERNSKRVVVGECGRRSAGE